MFYFEVGSFSMVGYDFGMPFFSSCRGYGTVGKVASTGVSEGGTPGD